MPQPLIVRAATIADAAAMTEILNPIVRAGGTTAIEVPLTEAELSEAFIEGPHVLCCHVAVDAVTGTAVGFQTLEQDATSERIDIATFARMHPKVAGVGTSLFAVTRRKARELGLSTITAQIRSDNQGGLAYYEKMGFRTFDTLSAVSLLDGTPVDRVLKRLSV